MAVLRNWSTTNAINLVIPAMHLTMHDDDKTDIFVEYLHNGVKFGSWGGAVKVEVYPNQGNCCESYLVKMSALGKPEEPLKVYHRDQLMSMCKEIYAYIQHNSINGQ